MAIDVIREVFPDAEVQWERTARVPVSRMTVDDTESGDEILTFLQRDMSDDFYGPAVDELRLRLREHTEAKGAAS